MILVFIAAAVSIFINLILWISLEEKDETIKILETFNDSKWDMLYEKNAEIYKLKTLIEEAGLKIKEPELLKAKLVKK